MIKLHSPKLHHIDTTNATKQRHKICNSFTKSLQWNNFKFKFVKNTFFTNKNENIFNDPWTTTTFIVLINELRNAIN
jgi:hypothetical protein